MVAAFLVAGCKTMGESQAVTGNLPDPLPDGWVSCPVERPQMCTRIYRPVCAWIPSAGVWKTQPSDCTACADRRVAGYLPGACE
jgi:hypothetical protein